MTGGASRLSQVEPAPFPNLIRVSVGSTSPPKIAAVRSAFERFGARVPVAGVAVATGVPDQPVGLEEIASGARNRARAAFAHGTERMENEESGSEFAVGIEDGLILLRELDSDPFNVACVVVTDGVRESSALSSAFAYPSACAAPALERREPIGDVFDVFWHERIRGIGARDARSSGRGEGNVGKLSLGVLTREEYARHAVVCALIRFLHADLYFTDPESHGPVDARKRPGRTTDE
jgi:inosine/xanthosine triphosphatase